MPGESPAAPVGVVSPDVAVMRVTLALADLRPAPLQKALRSQVLTRAGETAEGYVVVCRDAEGDARMGLLPFRSEWGQVTARSSEHDATLPAGTVRVLQDIPLRPGVCLLEAGRDYPVVCTSASSVTVRYTAGDFSRDLMLVRGQADVRPALRAEPVPLEQQLQAALETSDARQRALQDELRLSELRREKLFAALSRLRLNEVENARLAAELQRSGDAYEALGRWTPRNPQALDKAVRALAKAIRDRSGVEAGLQAAQIEAEPLRELLTRLLETEAGSHGLRADLAGRQAELDVLASSRLGEDAAARRTELLGLLDRARKDRLDASGSLTQTEFDRMDGSLLFDQLKAIKAENARINGRIAELLEQLAELREALKAADPGAPAPAGAPAAGAPPKP
jgi:hypothetical protein